MTDNPLADYFRKSDVFQSLPTMGKFFDKGEIELSITDELSVLPMTF
jgi:hypothetical protein